MQGVRTGMNDPRLGVEKVQRCKDVPHGRPHHPAAHDSVREQRSQLVQTEA